MVYIMLRAFWAVSLCSPVLPSRHLLLFSWQFAAVLQQILGTAIAVFYFLFDQTCVSHLLALFHHLQPPAVGAVATLLTPAISHQIWIFCSNLRTEIGEGKKEYTDDDLDEVREEWANYVANFIYRFSIWTHVLPFVHVSPGHMFFIRYMCTEHMCLTSETCFIGFEHVWIELRICVHIVLHVLVRIKGVTKSRKGPHILT